MADYDLIYPGLRIDDVLETAYELQQQGYIFRGVASEFSGTPTERTWLITGEGSTGYGFTTAVPKGCVGICLFNGSTWSGKVVKVVTLDAAPTSGSTNAVQSGAVYSMVNTIATSISNALNSLTFQETTVSGDDGIKLVQSLLMTSQGVTDILTSFTILAATTSKAGLLSASDKEKLDAILTNIRSMVVTDTTLTPNQGTELTESLKWTVGGVLEVISAFTILAATTSKAGLMSASDKEKLNTLFADGYKFAGIAVPSSTPMSTDAKIFYIATQAGTYTLFGDITLTDGINVLMYSGSAWSSVQVVGITDKIAALSSELLESGAAAGLLDALSSTTEPTPVVVEGKYMGDSGEVENQYMQYWKYSVGSGESFLFSGKFPAGTNVYFIEWLNGSTVIGHEPYVGSLEEDVEYVDQIITAPSNATYLCLNVNANRTAYSKVKKLGDLLLSREIKEQVLDNKKYLDPLRGDVFIFDRAGINTDGTFHPDWANGLAATDFLPITGNDDIVCENLWANVSVAGLAFYDVNKQFISVATGTVNATDQTDYNVTVANIPTGAAYIKCTVNKLRTGPHTIVSGVNLNSQNENISSLNQDMADVKNAVTSYDFTPLETSTVLTGGFYNRGTFTSLSGFQVNVYEVTGGNKYAFTGVTGTGANLFYVTWRDANDEYITMEPYRGSLTEPTSYTNQVIDAPLNAKYLCLNVQTSRASEFGASASAHSYISSSQLRSDVDSLMGSSMKVTISGSNIFVRTSLDDSNDIIIKFIGSLNGNMTPIETYMGSKDSDDATVMQNVIHTWADSTAPFRSVPQFWHLFAQHGIPVPLAVITDNPLTASDVGAVWKDQEEREFTIGKIDGNNVYLIPKVTASGTDGIVTRSWKDSRDGFPTSLTHVSGGVYTTSLTIASCSQYQLRPMQVSSNRKFTCNGNVVGDGIYMCNEFVISETLTCLDPTTMTAYFPTPASLQNVFIITNSFIFKGLSIGFNQLVSCENPFQFGYYASNQAQHLIDTGGKTAYVMIPKTKKNNANGDIMCKFFRSQTTDAGVTIYRTTSDLYDIDKCPEREISILKDGTTPVIGFASGLSLIKGITRDEVRNTFIEKSGTATGNALYLSPENKNKFYVGVVIGYNTQKFPNQLMQPDFCHEFSTYFSYFKPTEDVQTYYYNDGSSTVLYIHSERNTGRILVDVSKANCEGKGIEVVEKTSNATLYSDSVVNGKVCVSFDSADANYIVISCK